VDKHNAVTSFFFIEMEYGHHKNHFHQNGGEGGQRGEEEGSTDDVRLNIHKQSFTSYFIWV
jgi:hypothetical protein